MNHSYVTVKAGKLARALVCYGTHSNRTENCVWGGQVEKMERKEWSEETVTVAWCGGDKKEAQEAVML